MTTPSDGQSPVPTAESAAEQAPQGEAVEAPFDPYRFGKPDYPIAPEYAPPGYVPPAVAPPPVEQPYGQQPYGQPPHGQQPYGQQPYGQPPNQYPPPPYGAPPAPMWSQYPTPRQNNGKAIAALVFGILAVLFFWTSVLDVVPAILAVVFGSLGMSDAKRTGQPRGMALSGFILGLVGALAAMVFTIFVYTHFKQCFDDYSSGSSEFKTCINDNL